MRHVNGEIYNFFNLTFFLNCNPESRVALQLGFQEWNNLVQKLKIKYKSKLLYSDMIIHRYFLPPKKKGVWKCYFLCNDLPSWLKVKSIYVLTYQILNKPVYQIKIPKRVLKGVTGYVRQLNWVCSAVENFFRIHLKHISLFIDL